MKVNPNTIHGFLTNCTSLFAHWTNVWRTIKQSAIRIGATISRQSKDTGSLAENDVIKSQSSKLRTMNIVEIMCV
jgi:hypothetical protein